MSLLRYQPWDAFSQVRDEMNRLLKAQVDEQDSDNSRVVTSHWAPAVDIREEQSRFVIYADLPGVKVDDIEITMEKGVLTVRGERSLEKEEDRSGFRRIERARGTFYRRFSLPDSADAERIQAKSRDGVLEIVIPKQEKSQPRKIAVQA
ncbi:MAG: Spore protein SP21 [Gammaproteobacteria bacterium]|nr:Spore protein SP21 [Gammaproteobacteria bacterium]